MKRFRLLTALLLGAGLLSAQTAPKPKPAPSKPAAAPTKPAAGEKTAKAAVPPVVWKASTRALSDSTAIELRFPAAMISDGQVGNEAEASEMPLAVTPALRGRWVWRSTTSGVFTPLEVPLRGQKYTFAVAENLVDLAGQPVGTQAPFGISAASLAMTYRYPTWFSSSNAPRQPELIVQFNEKIALASAVKGLRFTDKDGATVPATVRQAKVGDLPKGYEITPVFRQQALTVAGLASEKTAPAPEAPLAGTVVVSPSKPLPAGEEWKLVIADIASADGKSKQTDAQTIGIGTVAEPSIDYSAATNEIGGPKQIVLRFNKELDETQTADSILKKLSIKPQPADFKAEFKTRTITIDGTFDNDTPYTVALQAGLKSADGLAMSAPFEEEMQFTMIEPVVALPAFSANQLAKGKGTLDVHVVNMGSVTVRVKAADRESLVYALRAYQNYTNSQEEEQAADANANPDEQVSGGGYARIPFDTMPGRKVYEETFTPTGKVDDQGTLTIDWKKALAGAPAGALFVTVEGEARPEWTKKKRKFGAQAFVQVSDIGLAWKLTPEELFVFAFSEATGQPSANVTLTAVDEENRPLANGKTDANGIARFPRGEAAWVIAQLDADLHAMPLGESPEGLGMWRFVDNYSWDPPAGAHRQATIFTDRPLYLPGETVFFKSILRAIGLDGIKRPAAAEKAILKAYDAKGRLFHERDVTLSDFGTVDGALELPVGTLGSYRLELVFPAPKVEPKKDAAEGEEEANQPRDEVFSQYFLVEEYKPNTFQIAFAGNSFKLEGEKASLPLQAKYLLGKPLSKAKLAWTAEVRAGSVDSDAFRDFRFLDSRQTYYWDEEGYHDVPEAEEEHEMVTGQAKTDLSDKGEAQLDFTVPAAPFVKKPTVVTVRAEVTDVNQQTITESWAKVLPSSDYYLGIRDLDSVSGTGSPVEIELAAADPEGQPWQQPVDAKVTVEKVEFVNVRVQTVGGGSNVKTDAKRTVVAEGSARVMPKGQVSQPFAWTPKDPGFFYITARSTDAKGRAIESVTSLQVYGESWATWEERDGVKIDLAADKELYQPGETARILVKSPVVGKVLVTVERRSVLKHFVTELKSNAQAIEVPLEEGWAPNAYVTVFVLRGAEANPKEIKEPDYKFGVCEVKIADKKSRLQLALAPGKPVYQPGDEGTASATVTDAAGKPVANAEVTFWAADDGILTLREYKVPDVWEDFHQPEPLAVLTGTTLADLLSENPKELEFTNKGYVIGGGGMEQIADKLRKNFQPVAFWRGALKTDATGKVSVTFTVPDNLTRFRLLGVAAAEDDRFGSAEGSFEVNKPLMIEPALPRFANVNDQVVLKGIVMNNTDKAFEADVAVELDALAKSTQPLAKKVSLAAHETKAVAFPVTFAESGTAKWKWSVKAPSVSLADAAESTLEVGYAQPWLRDLQYAALGDASEGQNILAPISPELLEGRGEVTLSVSNSTIVETAGALVYLLHYPYGCVEQTMSSTVPWLTLHDLGDAVPGVKRTPEDVAKAIQKGASRLLSMQTGNGGLAYWPGGAKPEMWASVYGGMGLVLCKRAGAVVPDNRLNQLAAFLSAQLRNTAAVNDTYELYNRAFACYTLALIGKPEPAYHDVLAQKLQSLPHPARALLGLAMLESGADKAAVQQVLDADLDEKLEEWTGNLFGSRLTALNLLVWTKLDPQNVIAVRLTERLLKERTGQGHWGSTYENAWALLALGAETKANAATMKAANLTVTFAGREEKIALPARPASATLVLPFTGQATERDLRVTGAAGAFLRASLDVKARPRLVPVEPRTNGFAVARRYDRVSADGSLGPVDALEVGDLVAVTLDLDVPARARYVAVDDPLPAIFEAVNPKFKSQAQTAAAAPVANAVRPLSWWSSFEELRKDRALFFADELWTAGKYQIRYLARVVAEGTVTAPPTKIEAMYEPEKYGLGGSSVIGARAADGKVAGQ